MNRGYIKTWRKVLDTGWLKNHKLWVFWSYCLLRASYMERDIIFGYQKIHLLPGQLILGRRSAAEDCGMTERQIRTCVRILENLGNITIKTTNKFSLITIVNWHIYQANELENDQQVVIQSANKVPIDVKQTTTYNKDNKGKNEKNKTYTSDFLLFWTEYPKKIGKDAAWKVWLKRNGDRPQIDKIIDSIREQKESDQWRKENGQYIPNPSTWLNQGRWDDEIKPKDERWFTDE